MHSAVIFFTCHPLFNLTAKEQTFPTQIKGPRGRRTRVS